MRTIPAELQSVLAQRHFLVHDLYTITLSTGVVWRFTDAGSDIVYNGHTYTKYPIKRTGAKFVAGLEVDTLSVTILHNKDTVVGGISLAHFASNGGFDGAMIEVSKIFLTTYSATTNRAVVWFVGEVGQVNPTRSTIEIELLSGLRKLTSPFPREIFQPSCVHSLYDQWCKVVKASFTSSGIVQIGNLYGGVSNLTNADGYFDLGVVEITSGANLGEKRGVKRWAGGGFVTMNPFTYSMSNGDTFTIYPGCDKTKSTCDTKYSNTVNYRGYPFIPVPETAF